MRSCTGPNTCWIQRPEADTAPGPRRLDVQIFIVQSSGRMQVTMSTLTEPFQWRGETFEAKEGEKLPIRFGEDGRYGETFVTFEKKGTVIVATFDAWPGGIDLIIDVYPCDTGFGE